jgi:hypothetical protein
MSTDRCDECEKYIHDREEIRVILEESSGFKRQEDEYEECGSYCLDCFNLNFSVARFARLSAKHVFENDRCDMCDLKINKKKQKHYLITASNNMILLECQYCDTCYINDIGG